MKKLLISSKLFVNLMSTLKFSCLRLDHFIQFLNNSCLNRPGTRVFESLLDSQRESALFVVPEESWFAHFPSCGSEFLEHWNLWVKRYHNGSPRSIMTDGRRQTGRQTFFLRVIGSSTARIRERLADGDVIVLEVIRGPIFDRGFLDVGFISLGHTVLDRGLRFDLVLDFGLA